MKFHRFRRSLTLASALVLVLSLLPVSVPAVETDGLCQHHTAHDEACGFAPALEAVHCTHACTESPACFQGVCIHVHEITCYNTEGNLSCNHVCINFPACSQTVHNCVHTHDDTCDYQEAQQEQTCRFFTQGCEDCKSASDFTLIELVATDITLDETEFTYTGEEIRPNVTVRVQGKLLTLGKDYTMEFVDNIQPGTAKVKVTGIATASETVGYTGTVEHPFFIAPAQKPETTEPTVPETTVPETSAPTEPSTPETTEPTVPETSAPTEPTTPETTEPTQPEKVTYKITKGNGGTWYRASNKALSFTANGKSADFKGVSIDGKSLDEKYFLTKDNTMVSLTSLFLEKLSLGKHTITIHFADGDAEGTFTIANPPHEDNPKTGDAFNLHLWSAALFMSLTGLAGIAFLYVRKRK